MKKIILNGIAIVLWYLALNPLGYAFVMAADKGNGLIVLETGIMIAVATGLLFNFLDRGKNDGNK